MATDYLLFVHGVHTRFRSTLADYADELFDRIKSGMANSSVLKREDLLRRRGKTIALHSPWVSFGGQFTETLRRDIATLAYPRSFLQKIIPK